MHPRLQDVVNAWRPLPPVDRGVTDHWWGPQVPVSRTELISAWLHRPGICEGSRGRSRELGNHIFEFAKQVTESTWGQQKFGADVGQIVRTERARSLANKPVHGEEAALRFGEILDDLASPLGRFVLSFIKSAELYRPRIRGSVTSTVRDKARGTVTTLHRELVTGTVDRRSILDTEHTAAEHAAFADTLSRAFAADPEYVLTGDKHALVRWCVQRVLCDLSAELAHLLWRLRTEPDTVTSKGLLDSEIDSATTVIAAWLHGQHGVLIADGMDFSSARQSVADQFRTLLTTDLELLKAYYGVDGEVGTHPQTGEDLDLADPQDLRVWIDTYAPDVTTDTTTGRSAAQAQLAAEFAVDQLLIGAAKRVITGDRMTDEDMRSVFLGSFVNAKSRATRDGGKTIPVDPPDGATEWWGDHERDEAGSMGTVEWNALLDEVGDTLRKSEGLLARRFGRFEFDLALEAVSVKDLSVVFDALEPGPMLRDKVQHEFAQGRPVSAVGQQVDDSVALVSGVVRYGFVATGYDLLHDLGVPTDQIDALADTVDPRALNSLDRDGR